MSVQLVDVGKAMQYRGVGGDAEVIFTVCVEAASAYLESRFGRSIKQNSYKHRLSGDGSIILITPQWPVSAVASLVVSYPGTLPSTTSQSTTWTVMGLDAAADSGEWAWIANEGSWIEARGGRTFPKGRGNIYCEYTAGYKDVPDDIQQAATLLAYLLFIERERIGVGSKTLGPEQIQQVLRNPKDYQFISQTISRYARHF